MRALLAFLTVALLAGCTNAPVSSAPVSPAQSSAAFLAPASPIHLAGVVWLNTTAGMDPATRTIPFELAGATASVTAKLHLATRVAGLESPTTLANVMASIQDAQNRTLAKAMLMPAMTGPDATLKPENLTLGTYRLVFETHGGSDGASNGDHLDYVVDAS
jgi:hypothetical protein